MGKARKAGIPASRVKVTISLDGAQAQRLRTFSRFHGKTMGLVVADALVLALRGFSVTQRTGSTDDVPIVEPVRNRETIGPPDLRLMTGT